MFESASDVETIVDPKDAAESAGLRYVSDARAGIRRRRSGKGFTYKSADGSSLVAKDVLRRIKSLTVPPAWTDAGSAPLQTDTFRQISGRGALSVLHLPIRLSVDCPGAAVQIGARGRLLLDPGARRFVMAENQAWLEIDAADRLDCDGT